LRRGRGTAVVKKRLKIECLVGEMTVVARDPTSVVVPR
jgi:hypothetical protein